MIKSWLTFVIFLFQIENIDFISKVRYKNRIIYEVQVCRKLLISINVTSGCKYLFKEFFVDPWILAF